MLRHGATRVQVACTTVPSRACYALRRCYKLRSYYCLQTCRGQLEGEILSGYSSQVQCSLVPSPTHSFSLLAIRTSLAVGQATKAGRGTGNEATTNLKLQLQTVNDERQLATSQAPPPASLISCAAPPGPPSLRSLRKLLACSTSVCQASPTMPCILLVREYERICKYNTLPALCPPRAIHTHSVLFELGCTRL